LSRGAVERIIQDIGYRLQHDTDKNMALSPTQQLLLAFRYLAGGGFMLTIGDAHGPAKSTVSRSVHAVVDAVNDHYFNDIVKWPAQMDSVVATFYKIAGVPSCVGAIDGSHVAIKTPSENEHQYVNRHGEHSINTMMVAGADYRFYYVSAKWPGSLNDQRVLRRSTLHAKFSSGWRPFPNGVLLGDAGYANTDWVITPILRHEITPAEHQFNCAHKKTRRIVECTFGVLKKRFARLTKLRLTKLRLSPGFAASVIKACTVLHNISVQSMPLEQDEIDLIMLDIEEREEEIEVNNENGNNAAGINRRAQLVAFF